VGMFGEAMNDLANRVSAPSSSSKSSSSKSSGGGFLAGGTGGRDSSSSEKSGGKLGKIAGGFLGATAAISSFFGGATDPSSVSTYVDQSSGTAESSQVSREGQARSAINASNVRKGDSSVKRGRW
jgi:hypothetical protein